MLLYVAILDSFSLLLAVTPSLPFLFSWALLWRSRNAVGRTQEFVIGVGLVGLWAFFLSRRKCGNVAHGQAKASKNLKTTTFRSGLLCHGTWDKDRQSGKFKSCQRWVLSSVESNHKQPDLIVTSPEKFEPCCGTWKQPQVSATPMEPTANSWLVAPITK